MKHLSGALDQILWTHGHFLCLAFIVVIALLASFAGAPFRQTSPASPCAEPQAAMPGMAWLYLVFGLAMGLYAAAIPAGESMTWYDANQLFSTFTGHQFYPPPIWPGAGRFFPLAHQEFQLLSLISNTLVFYHIFAAVEMLVLVAVLMWSTRNAPVWGMAVIAGTVLTPAVNQVFFELIYSERNMLLLMAFAVLGGQAWRGRGSLLGLTTAAASAAAVTLYKETAFLFVAAESAGAAAQSWFEPETGIRRRLLVLAGVLAVVCVVWLGVYAIAILPQIETAYSAWAGATRIGALEACVMQPWSWLLAVLLLMRLNELAEDIAAVDAIWDGVLVSAVIYAAAIIVLRFTLSYYMAPAAFLTWFYLLHRVAAGQTRRLNWLALGVLLIQLPATAGQIAFQKELVGAKGQAVAYLAAAGSLVPQPLRVHFPEATRYEAGLLTGLLQAQYGVEARAGISLGADTAFSDCTSDIHVPCADRMAMRPGDFLVGLGAPLSVPGTHQVFVSQQVGLWPNHYFVYVYQAN